MKKIMVKIKGRTGNRWEINPASVRSCSPNATPITQANSRGKTIKGGDYVWPFQSVRPD